jgi:hypothetical protein
LLLQVVCELVWAKVLGNMRGRLRNERRKEEGDQARKKGRLGKEGRMSRNKRKKEEGSQRRKREGSEKACAKKTNIPPTAPHMQL